MRNGGMRFPRTEGGDGPFVEGRKGGGEGKGKKARPFICTDHAVGVPGGERKKRCYSLRKVEKEGGGGVHL